MQAPKHQLVALQALGNRLASYFSLYSKVLTSAGVPLDAILVIEKE